MSTESRSAAKRHSRRSNAADGAGEREQGASGRDGAGEREQGASGHTAAGERQQGSSGRDGAGERQQDALRGEQRDTLENLPPGELAHELIEPDVLMDAEPTSETVPIARPCTGAPRQRSLSVSPEDLGADYLSAAVQEHRSVGPDQPAEGEAPVQEDAAAPASEQRLLAQINHLAETEAGLITQLPHRSDIESNRSQLSREALHWARQQGARSEPDILRKASEYLRTLG